MKIILIGSLLVTATACYTPSDVATQAFEHYSAKGHGKSVSKKDTVDSPVKADARSLANGKALFQKYCAVCHGDDAEGKGPRATDLPIKPADLTRLSSTKSDYSIFLQIAYGSDVMPLWKKDLSDDSRWDIVNYIRSLAK